MLGFGLLRSSGRLLGLSSAVAAVGIVWGWRWWMLRLQDTNIQDQGLHNTQKGTNQAEPQEFNWIDILSIRQKQGASTTFAAEADVAMGRSPMTALSLRQGILPRMELIKANVDLSRCSLVTAVNQLHW